MRARAIALSCFFLSGATGLLYEVVWTRLLGSVIGNTHFSITVVVSVFMGGLALGSYIGGRVADRSRNPLRLYGILTLLVGLTCLLVPLLIGATRPLFLWLYGSYDGQPEAPVLLVVRIVVSAIVLLVPTSFMGATLPALSRHFARKFEKVGGTVGALYAINTLGAVAGAAFTGFLGIPLLGIWGCIALAVVLDLAIAFAVILVARGEDLPLSRSAGGASGDEQTGQSAPRVEVATAAARLPLDVRLAVMAFGAVGFADMMLQIAWTKAIVLSIGNSTYAFSLIVSLFILGIAVGGGLVSLFVDRLKNLLLVLGILIIATGALVSVTIPLLGYFPIIAARWFDSIEDPSYGKFLLRHVALVSCVILPSTILMGTIFPIVGKIRTRAIERVGTAIGSAYFWNTVGSILGTLAAGFVFIPLLGRVYNTLYLGAGLSLLTGAVLLLKAPRPSPVLRLVVTGTLLTCVLASSFLFRPHGVLGATGSLWRPSIMSRGAYAYYKGTYRRPNGDVIPQKELVDRLVRSNEVIFFKEGIHAPVAVVRSPRGEVAMRISGKVEASMAPGGGYNNDVPHQILAGHLPMILHPNPKDVLTLGLGGGVTLGTLILYPVESVDSLEISPEVIEAARDYFASANRGALTHPKVRNVVGDGRNHLEYTRQRYDVITSVPSNPWIAGIGNLFTVEFFETCRDRLNEGGIICNWIHKINMRAEDYRTVVRTFVHVFPEHAQLWDIGYDTLLVGATSPIRLDANRLEDLLKDPEVARDLGVLGITGPETMLRHFLMHAPDLARYAGKGPLNTDSYPVLEFSCPYGLYGHQFDAYRSLAFFEPERDTGTWVTGLEPEADMEFSSRTAFRIYQAAEANLSLLSAVRAGQLGAAELSQRAEVREMAHRILQSFKTIHSLIGEVGDPWLDRRAAELSGRAWSLPRRDTLSITIAAHLLNLAAQAGSPELKAGYLEVAPPYLTDNTTLLTAYAGQWLNLGRPRDALPAVEAAVSRMPANPVLLNSLGVLQGASGMGNEALSTFRRALEHATEAHISSEIHYNIGFAHESASRIAEALREYRKALEENPENRLARARLDRLENPPGN